MFPVQPAPEISEWIRPSRSRHACDDDRTWLQDEHGISARRTALEPETPSPVTEPIAKLEERFAAQAEKWDRETAHLSSPAQRCSHPSYMAILGMANEHRKEIIKLMLLDMQHNSREWFWALSYLTQDNPISRNESGRLDRMIEAWVRWGKQRGYL
jgi:hypothetical protein